MGKGRERVVRAEEARVGMKVRVGEDHRRSEERGAVGKIVGRYGAPEYMALDVRLLDGGHQLFWARDLEEASAPQPWWRLARST